MVDFDKLNQATRDWNNGITRNINPTDYCGGLSSSSTNKFGYYNEQTYYYKNNQFKNFF